MHLLEIQFFPENYPTSRAYPFHLPVFQKTRRLSLSTPVTFMAGENGTGKSTLLRALCHRCGIHIWEDEPGKRTRQNPHEENLYQHIRVQWADEKVPGSFFGSDTFRHFAGVLEEWAAADPENLNYFGGASLLTQSHGQSLMSYFKARYQRKGLYLMDEPETALSPRSQIELVRLLRDMAAAGHAQFIVITHSPILLACPDATIYSFDQIPIQKIPYEKTDYYRIYKDFLLNPDAYLSKSC